jgi:hypothetical protein
MVILILKYVSGGSDMSDSRRLSDEDGFWRIRLIRTQLVAYHFSNRDRCSVSTSRGMRERRRISVDCVERFGT